MDPKELRGLYEAYSEVYMQEEVEQIDEISAGLAGKVVNARIERTGAAADRENRARTPQNVRDTVAAADKEAKARKLAAGVRARRAANEEVEIEEGYKEPRLDRKAFVKHANKRSGFSLGTREDPHGWREPGMEKVAKEFAARTASSRKAKRTGQTDAYKAEKEAQSKLKKEHFDIFDVVLEFLQAEGYAETLEEAEKMMANVLNAEAINIILGEAQEARNNPEKYEREQSKKSAPVRGERTPMPPRGDKRREDFEKWYAANVR
jgi:hypothetical protein